MKKILKSAIKIIIVTIITVTSSLIVYVKTYYTATSDAISASQYAINIDGDLVFEGDKKTAIIIYGGAKIENIAFSKLAKALNENGYTVFLPKLKLNFALLDINRAKEIIQNNSKYTDFVLVGHSLGGTAASMYASENPDKIKSLIFLGSYPNADLSKNGIKVLSIFGDKDLVLSKDRFAKSNELNPVDTIYFEIVGGNHAQFGNYGDQKGDGIPEISDDEQQAISVEQILNFIK